MSGGYEVMSGIRIRELRALYAEEGVARALLDSFADRTRNRRETTVDQLAGVVRRAGLKVERSEVIDVLRLFGDLGLGVFVVGRRGRVSRFEWRVGTVSAGQAARGERERVAVLDAFEEEETAEESAAVECGDDEEGLAITHSYVLRPEQSVTFRLPADLTRLEADRLADFIRTLPFEASEEDAAEGE